jgi:hypothetical protein
LICIDYRYVSTAISFLDDVTLHSLLAAGSGFA